MRTRPKTLLLIVSALGLPGTFTPIRAVSSVIYTYDQLGRLSTALYDNGLCIAYIYDAAGNRTSQTNTISGAPESPIWGSGVWGCFPWTPH